MVRYYRDLTDTNTSEWQEAKAVYFHRESTNEEYLERLHRGFRKGSPF